MSPGGLRVFGDLSGFGLGGGSKRHSPDKGQNVFEQYEQRDSTDTQKITECRKLGNAQLTNMLNNSAMVEDGNPSLNQSVQELQARNNMAVID